MLSGFFFDFVFGQTVNQMTDTYHPSIHPDQTRRCCLSCPNCPFHAAIVERAADPHSSDLITTSQTFPHYYLLSCSWMKPELYTVRIMQSNQNQLHVKIFSKSWDKWGNNSPRGRCAEILTECLIMSWENGPDAININSQRNCSGRHFCSNNTNDSLTMHFVAEKWTFSVWCH